MTAPPALVARTTLVAEATWKAVLRRGLQAVAGGSTGWSDRTRSIGRSNFPLSSSNIPRSERPHVPWHLCPTDGGNDGGADAFQCTVADWFEPFSRPD